MNSHRYPRTILFLAALLAIAVNFAVSHRATAGDFRLSIETPQSNDSSGASPPRIYLQGRDARWQLQVCLEDTASGRRQDVTRQVRYSVEPSNVVRVDATGFVQPMASGSARILASTKGEEEVVETSIAIEVSGMETQLPVNFPNQVVPIFTKLGCNGGGCHGKAAGQAGFRLSLLGFEPEQDYQHLIHESRGRRLFPALPEKSLLLEKATGASPHGGGQRLEKDSHEYRLLQRWIAGGMPYGSDDDPVVTRIDVRPPQRTLERGQSQQLAVWATYSDGTLEDITRTTQFESNNTDLADVSQHGLVQLGQVPGDVAIMARYQGQVGVFRASIPLGAAIANWPEAHNVVDEFVFAKLKTLGIPPSPVCDDGQFIRRVTLDVCGRLPSMEESQAYLADDSPDKLETLVDRLLASTDYAEYFAKKWTTILRNRRDGPGEHFATHAFHDWLRSSLHQNKPYDQWIRELLTATGSVHSNPPVAWHHEVSDTESRVEDAAQLFLGQRIQCARCHHHPFEKWSQKDYYHMAAFFSKVTRKEGPTPDEPRYVSRVGNASARHPVTNENLPPAGLDGPPLSVSGTDDPRQHLVDWMVQADNPFFARSLANRYWKHFFAVGLVEPEDDMRATNPPTNPELLDGLAGFFVDSGYDLKALVRLICTSTAYRLSSNANQYNLTDTSYARFYPKRMQAEVLLDAVDQVVRTQTSFDGLPPATRAVSLPHTGFSSYFLDVFGKPDATSACECERSQDATLAQSLHLLNSKEMQAKLSDDSGLAAGLAASSDATENKIQQLYLAAFSRYPTVDELQAAQAYLGNKATEPRQAYEDLVWAIVNSKEFIFNH